MSTKKSRHLCFNVYRINLTCNPRMLAKQWQQSVDGEHPHLQITNNLNLKSAKGEKYARSHPPPECDLEKWKNLIDKKWNDSNWLDNMIKIQDEHYSQPSRVPITLEELSVKVLKRRSGYVKGLRLRPSFSVRTTSASTDSDYVSHPEMEI